MKEKFDFAKFIANRLPRSVCYWVVMRIATYVSTHEHSNKNMNDITMMDALKTFDK